MSRQKPQRIIEDAISAADTNYFFEDYSKQAVAVLRALDRAGYVLAQKDAEIDPGVWVQAANEMRTGRIKPEEHVKDVYQTVLRILAAK